MKTKYYFLAALASVMLASCSSDDFIAEGPSTAPEGVEGPIVFSSLKGNYTRADFAGKDAADLLGGKFVVSGYKGASTASVGDIVFDNYLVEYGVNTANTTESNTNNWEYVGKGLIKHAADKGITRQTIKYWDYSKAQYDFIAWSTGEKTAIYEGTPNATAGEVLVSAITPATAIGNAETDASVKAYTFTGSAANLKDCYIADLVTVKKANYNQPVTLRFRALGAKVRIGIYETIPGYSVKDVKFYTEAANALATDGTQNTPTLFTTTAGQIYNEGTYTVYFPTVDDATPASDKNQAHIKFTGVAGDQKSYVQFGDLQYTIAEDGEKTTGASFLGRSSNTASMAGQAQGNFYTQYLPNESGTNLNLRVNYTLESTDGSGETIEVKGATAQVPSIYTQWKAGYAYTYLFKISDKTNGYTGVYDPTKPDDTTVNSDPAGLYPITFDAVVVNAEEENPTQETITTVSAPSITSYQKGSNVVNANEYTVLTTNGNIYVTVNDGAADATNPALANGALQVLSATNAKLYTVPAGTTEAAVVDALQYQDDDKGSYAVLGRNKVGMNTATLNYTNKVEYGVDGNTITLDANKAAYFGPVGNTTFAFVYTKTAPTGDGEVIYQPVAFDNTAVTTKYRYDYKAATAGDVQKGVLYFTEATGVYTKKASVFLGQNVNNLMVRSGAGTTASPYTYTQASGYAVTDTEYCYGTTNKLAKNIAYADFATAELYVAKADGTGYVAKTETAPVDGKAYYYKETDGSYTYCVILPEQATDLYVLDTTKYVQATENVAVEGQTYFDKYTKNNGVYYAKVIKVQ